VVLSFFEQTMSVKKSEIAYISSLSKLKMEDAEMDNYTRQISEILEMIQQLEKVDTHDIEPMAHPLNMKQRLRLDLVTEENRRELYQKNAVVLEEGFYKVPKVIE
jgi:aspartyl-tRNA(Asn)/glutamyl-tRNA(Gln) amidotransferase subunit C|tara:strand:- start:1414 stop:1728 length:315 start_codon:yes stop_codon:yes gene_type:complete